MLKAVLIMLVWTLVWITCYIFFIRKWLMQYAVTANLLARIQAAEGALIHKVGLWFEGKKALLVTFVISGLSAAKSAADATVTGLRSADLDPLRDAGLWHGFFSDDMVLKIMSGLGIVAGLLAIRGHLVAARLQPKE